ncbi:hypothetical protein FDG2_5487 [Candidatus Protofrankia californiensis]|uniref:Uncharacterized protein n=1 Tax=Candidatus Protofrankia californiensis TaxID=1839754 RepID=A0A1C3PDR5_9ACTN|nr:hypothetical protein FDG2_5487 [Candidatus Protofrankia californiensis]
MDADVAAILAPLKEVTAADLQALDRVCETTAASLVAAGVEPPFQVTSADLAGDPWLICAERYWGHRLRALPTIETAARCARWLGTHATGLTADQRAAISESWALRFAYTTRDTVESHHDLTAAVGSIVSQYAETSPDVCIFAALFHAGVLRANYWFDELHLFLESSPLTAAAGGQPHRALFTALRAFAAYGSRRRTVEYAANLCTEAWAASPRSHQVMDVLLHALSVAPPFPGQGEQLRARAEEAVAAYPDDHTFRFRLATGQRRCARYAEAADSLDTALQLLSAAREWDSPFRPQYLRDREMTLDLMRQDTHAAVPRQETDSWDMDAQRLRRRALDPTAAIRLVGLVAVLAIAVLVFTGGMADAGQVSLRIRLGQEAALGGSLLLLALIVNVTTRLVVGRRGRPF